MISRRQKGGKRDLDTRAMNRSILAVIMAAILMITYSCNRKVVTAGSGSSIRPADNTLYDLTYVEKNYGDSLVFKKWRIFIDKKTNIPHRIEFYDKMSASEEYTLRSLKIIDYFDESSIQILIKKYSL